MKNKVQIGDFMFGGVVHGIYENGVHIVPDDGGMDYMVSWEDIEKVFEGGDK